MEKVHISVRLGKSVAEKIDAEALGLGRSRNWVIEQRLEFFGELPEGWGKAVDLGRARKKIAKIMVGGAAKGGATPGLSAVGKAQDEEDFSEIFQCIGRHSKVVLDMRSRGRSWDAIGMVIGWTGYAVREWYEAEGDSLVNKKIAEELDGVEGRSAEGKIGGVAGGHAEAVAEGPHGAQGGQVGVGKQGIDMDALRAICAGNIPGGVAFSNDTAEIDLCGFKSYNETDGEFYVCGKEKHDVKIKHGDWIQV